MATSLLPFMSYSRHHWRGDRRWIFGLALASCFMLVGRSAAAQPAPEGKTQPADTVPAPRKPGAPGRVEVEPIARDGAIRNRVSDILRATGWFTDTDVTVNEGVVFLKGRTSEDEHKQWASDLVRNTEGVVAVVNLMESI
jgi:small conductance mechanosensitive channel